MLNNPVTTKGLLPYSGLSYLTYGLWIEAEEGTTKALAGVIQGQSQLIGTLTRLTSLNAIITAQSSFEATLVRIRSISGLIDAQSDLEGTLNLYTALNGVLAGQTDLEAYLNLETSLNGTVDGQSTLVGTANLYTALNGLLDAQSQVLGTLTRIRSISGLIDAQSQILGTLTRIRGIQGLIDSQSDLDGTLNLYSALNGILASQTDLGGYLNLETSLNGTVTGQSSVEGYLNLYSSLNGILDSQSQFIATLSRIRGISGILDGQSSFEALLTRIRGLNGILDGQSSFEALLTRIRGLNGVLEGTSELLGYLNLYSAFNGILDAQADLDGYLNLYMVLRGEIAAKAELTGILGLIRSYVPFKKYVTTILPESILQRIIVNGINELKNREYLIDYIFNNLDQGTISDLKRMFVTYPSESISVHLAFQKRKLKVPAIVITVGGEEERGTFLRKRMAQIIPQTHTPDYRSVMNSEERFLPYNFAFSERYGSYFSSSYNFNVIAESHLESIFIYNILKFILLSNIVNLEKSGIIDSNLSGRDLSPIAASFPDVLFNRQLTLDCQFSTDFIYGFGEESLLKINSVMDVITQDHLDSVILLKFAPVKIHNVTPNTIRVGVETDIIIEGDNFDKDAEISFPGLPFETTMSGTKSGIEILDTNFYTDNNFILRVLSHSTGTTGVKIINPNRYSNTWTTLSVTI